MGKHESRNIPVGSRTRAEQLDAAWRFLDAQLDHHHHSAETKPLAVVLTGVFGRSHRRVATAWS